jgi:predicted porin
LENFEMKKTLVAVAALVATGAFAQVTIGGAVDMAVVQSSEAGVTSRSIFGATNEFSNITFRGEADTSVGLKAEAFMDLGLYDRAGGAQMTRELFVGLKSPEMGSLRLGRQLTPLFLAAATNEVNGAPAAAGGLEGVLTIVLNQGIRDARRDNTIQYVSPTFSGITVNAQTTEKNTIVAFTPVTGAGAVSRAEVKVGTGYGYGIKFATGAFAAQYQAEETVGESILNYIASRTAAPVAASATTDTTSRSVLALSYDFGIARAHYMYGAAKHTAMSNKGDYFGIAVPMGAITLTASYNVATSKAGATTSKMDGMLGKANYALSKQTNVYFITGQDNFTTAKSKLVTNSFGISHAF